MNKMCTATAVMQLVEAGKLSLDDSVGKVMTDYPNADVARRVTVRHLLVIPAAPGTSSDRNSWRTGSC
jgi:D-alanyl-D-alanine carboxypeptidase